MARAKNTQRAQARRRHREQIRINEFAAGIEPNELDDGPDGDDAQEAAPAGPKGIAAMFARPDFRGDLRALPGMFRTKKLLWLPFVILLAAFLIVVPLQAGLVPPSAAGVLGVVYGLVLPLVLQPSALFVPFIGGFLAPRGSYMIGFLIGLVQAIFYSSWVVVGTIREAKLETLPAQLAPATASPVVATRADLVGSIVSIFVVSLLFGTVAAAFASWYRNFLRNSQMRAQQNRAIRDKQTREKAKEREREQRIAERDARKSGPRKVVP